MMKKQLIVSAMAAMLVLPLTARAEDIEGKWSVSLEGGTDLELSGDVHGAGTGEVLSLPTSVEARSYKDIYGSSFRGQLSVGYGIAPRVELFGRGSYYKMKSDVVRVGSVAGLALFGEWSDYEEWGVEAGPRFYFSTETAFKPYLAGVVGLRFLSANPATFSVPAANVVLSDVPFLDKSTVGVFGADLGFSYDVATNVAIGIEAGLRYQTKPSDLEGLAGTGLENINDTGSRWSLPVLGTVRFRF
jgi:hypothetical protein